MVSDFTVEHLGWVKAHRVIYKTGPNNYWNWQKMLSQVKKVEQHLTETFQKYEGNENTFTNNLDPTIHICHLS